MRLVVYTDYVYRRREGTVYAERAFALFLVALAQHVERLTVVGRLDPGGGPMHYPLPRSVEFVPLPHYESLARPWAVLSSLARSLGVFSAAMRGADVAWLLGPSPHGLAFALAGLVQRRTVVLGVRQDYPAYVRSRRPGRGWMHVAADLLELSWRALARRCAVVAVGPQLASHYRRARELLEITVSLISSEDVAAGEAARQRPYEGAGALRVLSVGRLEEEKNPLLLCDVLERLGEPWRMVICGEGPLARPLAERFAERGLTDRVELPGYLPLRGGLLELYRSSHVFLHVSLTEGMPQVLIEAFASGVPVVATAVGGVPDAAGDAALLVPPSDGAAAADAVARVAEDRELRERLITAGLEHARRHTLERETARVVRFIER